MNKKTIQILSTKKLSTSQLQLSNELGICITDIDFISIHTRIDELSTSIIKNIQDNDFVIFTSKYAVQAVASHLKSKSIKVYCINGATLNAVQNELPLSQVIASAAYAADLVPLIKISRTSNYYFFCGNKSLPTIPQFFIQNEMLLNKVVVYENIAMPQQIQQEFDGVMFYSPSGVESFLKMNTVPSLSICIGTTTANALKDEKKIKLIAEQPQIENMIALIKRYYL